MNDPARKGDQWTDPAGTVVPFPRTDPSSSAGVLSSFPIGKEAFSNPELESRLKQIVEGAVLDAYVKYKLGSFVSADDPFSSIYIAELTPDRISSSDVSILKNYKDIKDLSGTILFSDGWDD